MNARRWPEDGDERCETAQDHAGCGSDACAWRKAGPHQAHQAKHGKREADQGEHHRKGVAVVQ